MDDLERQKDPTWPYRFDNWHGSDVCDFTEKLPHVEGQWTTPTIRLEPAQVFSLVVVFGWRRRSNGKRRFTRVYMEMARKGAKSTLTAAVGLYCLTCEGEIGPQIIIGATTGEQAGKVFNPAKRMVQRTPDLRAAFGVAAWARSITCGENGGFIQPINSKGKTQDGWNPHVGILDELHAHKDRALFDVIRSAFGSRDNPLMWIITTAGYDMNGVCYEQRQFVVKVLEGVLEAEHYFGIIFTLDEGDNPYDERVWIKANPMLGITPKLDEMRGYAAEAAASPASEGEFKTKRLNIWLNASAAWLNMAQWAKCAGQVRWEDFEGLDCYIGGDLADKDDITALVLSAIDTKNRLIEKPVFWLPENSLIPGRNGVHADQAAQYRAWQKQGHIQLTPGDWVDHGAVEDQIREWKKRFSIRRCTFDQFAAAQLMASRLNEDFAEPDRPFAAVLHKAAKNVTDPAKELEARVKAGPERFVHDGNPVMTWMASSVVVSRRTDGSILPKKETPMSANKIDGIDALINGMAPIVFAGTEEKPPVAYSRGGMFA